MKMKLINPNNIHCFKIRNETIEIKTLLFNVYKMSLSLFDCIIKWNRIFQLQCSTTIIPKSIKYTILLFFLLQCISLGVGDSDWLQNCGTCHCHWNSGKKTADCKNRTIQKIPTFFSSQLQVIDLSYNQIPEIRRDEFYDASLENLHKIFMKNCTTQELNRDSFKGLAVLFELDLSNNYIRILQVGTFSSLHKLRNLIMNHNEIEILESKLFDGMKFLSRVEFKHNRLKKIEIDVFRNVENLSLIYLESNRLTYLRKETFENITRLKDLTLASNPWNCTCELQPFRDFSIDRNLYTPPTDCAEPLHLRGKLWTDVPTEHFACKPKIIQPRTQSYLEANNENVTIICRIRGIPKPDVFWLFNKRPLNTNEQRIQIRNAMETSRKDYDHVMVSELTIIGLRSNDRGTYTCMAENRGGKEEVDIILAVNVDKLIAGIPDTDNSTSNLLLIICLIAITLLLLLIVVVLVLCWYCRKVRHYSKETTMSENGLITSKMEKTQNGSVLEGSVIMEMQKSLLTEVNPVEKPPRRTEIESIDQDDIHEIKKTLLDETPFASQDEETNSVALSDTTPRSRATYVDDGYGTNLPPDLLSFPAQRVPQSPSLQSSMSNIQIDNRTIYGKSPLSSPVYQHVLTSIPPTASNGIYGTAPAQFRTLQHPKNRNLAMVANSSNINRNNQSPFIPAPVVYPSVIMKQGYMTIPRKPRVPSWTPSVSSPLSEFQNASSPLQSPSIIGTDISDSSMTEPVYDNLGLRTTAGGNSLLSLNKIGITNGHQHHNNNKMMSPPLRYTMKDRPLPATPNTTVNTASLNNSNNQVGNNGGDGSSVVGGGSSSGNRNGVNSNIGVNTNISNSNNSSSNNGGLNGSSINNGSGNGSNNGAVNNNFNSNNINNNSLINNGGKITNNSQVASKIYEPIHEISNLTTTSDTEPLYGTAKSNSGVTIVPSLIQSSNNSYQSTGNNKISKIPPRPPPKPKKKLSVTSTGHGGSTSQLFEDEGEDGTEV